jgi:hypothetical protein
VSVKKKGLQSLIEPACPCSLRAELEGACRLATEEPVSVEVIYDQFVRRASVMFLSDKRVFRAITVAM